MKRIVIIHAGAIGDLVQALPVLQAVRAAWPAARMTFIGRPERAVLARLAAVADECVDMETCGLWRLHGHAPPHAPALRLFEEADLVLDFLSKGALAAGLKAARPAGQPHHPQMVSIDPLPPPGWEQSAAEWLNTQVAARLALTAFPPAPLISMTESALHDARRLLALHGISEPLVAIHPGSGSAKKNWPMDRFAAVARHLQDDLHRKVLWLAGPAERERGTLGGAPPVGRLLADLALNQVAAILALADAYLGNDSGITQVAAAVQRPDGRTTLTVALFGPTQERVWAPRGGHVWVMASADGSMEGLAAERVWAELRELLT